MVMANVILLQGLVSVILATEVQIALVNINQTNHGDLGMTLFLAHNILAKYILSHSKFWHLTFLASELFGPTYILAGQHLREIAMRLKYSWAQMSERPICLPCKMIVGQNLCGAKQSTGKNVPDAKMSEPKYSYQNARCLKKGQTICNTKYISIVSLRMDLSKKLQ